MSILSREVVQLEDCSIELIQGECCGVVEWYAKLPGYWKDYTGEETNLCCEFAEHPTRERAIECAKSRITKGLYYHAPVTEPG